MTFRTFTPLFRLQPHRHIHTKAFIKNEVSLESRYLTLASTYLKVISACTLVGAISGAIHGAGAKEGSPARMIDHVLCASYSGIEGGVFGMAVGIASPFLIPVTAVSLPAYYLSLRKKPA